MPGIDSNDLLFQDGIHTGQLMAVDVGEEVWIPVSPVRDGAFRAVKVEVKDRASVGGYEEKHAIEPWDKDAERLYGRSVDTGGEQADE